MHKVVHDPARWPARANIQFESEGAASTFNYLTPITTNSGGAKTYIQHGALPDSIRKGCVTIHLLNPAMLLDRHSRRAILVALQKHSDGLVKNLNKAMKKEGKPWREDREMVKHWHSYGWYDFPAVQMETLPELGTQELGMDLDSVYSQDGIPVGYYTAAQLMGMREQGFLIFRGTQKAAEAAWIRTAGCMAIEDADGMGHMIRISCWHPEATQLLQQPICEREGENHCLKTWVICMANPLYTMQAGMGILARDANSTDRARQAKQLYMSGLTRWALRERVQSAWPDKRLYTDIPADGEEMEISDNSSSSDSDGDDAPLGGVRPLTEEAMQEMARAAWSAWSGTPPSAWSGTSRQH